MQLKDAAYNMFGFIVEQPLHKSLRQMRIATIIVLSVCIDIMYELVEILRTGGNLSPSETVAAVAGLATVMVGAIWKGISNLSDKHHNDE